MSEPAATKFAPDGETPKVTAAMTHEQRAHLRHLIDQAKRRQLTSQPPHSPKRNQAKRRASYAAYYWRNREQIAERRAKKRAA